jgi:hypothetical protein
MGYFRALEIGAPTLHIEGAFELVEGLEPSDPLYHAII